MALVQQCTASETSASSIDLTLIDSTQSNIRVRACTSSGDSLQNNNANVALSISRIGVTISPLTASQGDTLTASYSGHVSGTPTWLCYISDTSKTSRITTSITCSDPGTSNSITTAGRSSVQCTPKETDGSSVSLTWGNSAQKYIRARACTANGDTQQLDNDDVRIGLPVSVSLNPTTINPGGNITATYTNRVPGRPTWLCYKSGTSAIGTSPECGSPGSSYTITSGGSVQCTASETSASSIDLTLMDYTQSNIRVRACTSSGDSLQNNNPNVALSISRIGVTISPLTASQGDTLTASYSGHVSGTPTWLCYISDTSKTSRITSSITCSDPGTSTNITTAGSGSSVQCTPKETGGSSVSLTWGNSAQKYIRARACTANGDTQQLDNDDVRIGLPVSVSLNPTTINPGGNITATYTNRVPGRPTWLCYKSGTSAIGTSPECGSPGSSYTITSGGSGTTVQCTASETSASSIDLTLMDYTQSNIRVRACTSSGDSRQNDNANVALSISKIGVTISPLTASQGDTLTASYSGHVSGTPTWLCYKSSTSAITTSITCSDPGTSTNITTAGSGSSVQCTPKETDGSSVSLTWGNSAQKYIRARACTANGDTQQLDNDDVRIGLPVSVSLNPTTINPGGNITATYTNRVPGRPTWLCYKSGTGAIGTSPECGSPGSSYTITSGGSGTTVQCTANETSASSINLTLIDYTQSNIRVRACTSSGDSRQNNNPNVALSISRIGVTISPLTASQGDTLTASYSGHVSGTPTWLCYKSSTSAITTSINCSDPGTSNSITTAGSGSSVQCTPKETDGSSVSLTWGNSAQNIYEQGLVLLTEIPSNSITMMFASGCQFLYRLTQQP